MPLCNLFCWAVCASSIPTAWSGEDPLIHTPGFFAFGKLIFEALVGVLIQANTTIGVGHGENIGSAMAAKQFDFGSVEIRIRVIAASGLLSQERAVELRSGPAGEGTMTASSS